MKINYDDKPKESLETLLEKYSGIFLILDDVLDSKKSYQFIYQDILDILKLGFEIKEIRTKPIFFKIHKKDKKKHQLEIRNFLSNLILWQYFIGKPELLTEDHIFNFKKFSIDDVVEYVNEKILPFHDGDFYSMNKTMDEICYHMTAISYAFCMLMGMSVSVYDIIQAEKRNPEMSEIIFGEIDPTLQPIEIEAEITRRTNRLIELFVNDPGDNDLKPLFISGKNLSPNQFKEILVQIGFKADINGNTIPIAIDSNFLITGLNKPSYLYINALSGRKSLILTKTKMGEPGRKSRARVKPLLIAGTNLLGLNY